MKAIYFEISSIFRIRRRRSGKVIKEVERESGASVL